MILSLKLQKSQYLCGSEGFESAPPHFFAFVIVLKKLKFCACRDLNLFLKNPVFMRVCGVQIPTNVLFLCL